MSTEKLVAAVRLLLATSGPKTEQQYECWKPLKEGLAELESAPTEPVAWKYTLEYGASIADTKVSTHQLRYPFGVCGADYSQANSDGVSYVRETPLYAAPAVPVSTNRSAPVARKPYPSYAEEEATRKTQEAKPAPAVDPCLALWQAMNEAEKYGQRTDDKLIVKFLREAGYVIAPAAPSDLCERICSAIKATDDKSVDEAGCMRDSNDCIAIVREQFAAAPAAPAPIHVSVGCMKESNGRETWMVMLTPSPDTPLTEAFQVYSSASEGRARYTAADLLHRMGLGPMPDPTAFDTELPAAPVAPAPEPLMTGYLVRDRNRVAEAVAAFGPTKDFGYLWSYMHGADDIEATEACAHLEVVRLYSAPVARKPYPSYAEEATRKTQEAKFAPAPSLEVKHWSAAWYAIGADLAGCSWQKLFYEAAIAASKETK
jgi:hypothetical protein